VCNYRLVFGLCRVLPHGVVDEMTPVCLFVSDVDRNERDYSITVDKYREMLDQLAIKPHIDVFAIFTASCYASAVYALCPSVSLSIHLSQVGVLLLRLAKSRITQTKPYDSSLLMPKISAKFRYQVFGFQ